MARQLKLGERSSAVVDRYKNQLELVSRNDLDIAEVTFAHAALTQVYLPYRRTDDDLYEVTQGNLTMRINDSKYVDKETGKKHSYGIPCGTRARLLLFLINRKAIMSKQRSFQLARSFRNLCDQLNLPKNGRSMNAIKEQFTSLSTCTFSWEYAGADHRALRNFQIIDSVYISRPTKGMKNIKQRDVKGIVVELGEKYFNNLMNQGVPMDERTVKALQNNSMCLDIYAWLTHRLYRIPGGKPQFIPWKAIQQQFGRSYADMKNFKRDFRTNLENVRLQYPGAVIREVKNKGFEVYKSPPSVNPQLVL